MKCQCTEKKKTKEASLWNQYTSTTQQLQNKKNIRAESSYGLDK